jgi:hypothetical protein
MPIVSLPHDSSQIIDTGRSAGKVQGGAVVSCGIARAHNSAE